MKYDYHFRERYLSESLNEAEKLAYETDMLRHPDLVEELKRHIYLHQWVGMSLEEEKKNEEKLNEVQSNKQLGSIRLLKWINDYKFLIAAGILLLVVSMVLFFYLNENKPNQAISLESLYASNFRTMSSPISYHLKRGFDNSNNSDYDLKTLAFQAYNMNNWELSNEYFRAFLQDSVDEDALFYVAMTEIELNDHKNAKKHLENYVSRYHIYEKDAQWYLALVNLKLGLVDESKKVLERLSAEESPFRQRSNSLLNSLHNF